MSHAARSLQREALMRRLAEQPPAVQALLRARAEATLAGEVAAAVTPASAPAPASANANAVVSPPAGPRAAPRVEWPRVAHASDELASVARFRRAWSRTRAQDSVLHATTQRPPNAGPLNSQVLVLESLALMRVLPGDYLRHFVAHVESLLWLEAAATQAAPAPARRARKPRRAA